MNKKIYKSCTNIESSLYVAPNEIRACCQRFFYKGKMRGDTKLLEIQNSKSPSIHDITKARNKLLEEIQNDKNESCLGCPFISKELEKPIVNEKISHLSIEHHSVCNLRCSYCSETYWGGKRSKYNVVEFIKNLSENGALSNCKQVVWGGGEPTLDKTFEIIVNEIERYASPKLYHRVFTNAIRHHPAIETFLKKNLIKIVTSVDAGTEETFKKVRGRVKFKELFENLKRYASVNPDRVTIKYILTDDNQNIEDLKGFAEKCLENNLIECCYQVSMNYKNEDISIQYLKSILLLMSLMKKNGIKKFFCDDHISQRFKKLNDNDRKLIMNLIKDENLEDLILKVDQNNHLNIYGAGDIAKNITSKSILKEDKNFIKLFDSDTSKIGNKLNGLVIENPIEIKNNKNRIFISAAQAYDDVFSNLLSMNIDKKRIVSGIFL
jgi:poly(ribitol-phosphate) beta-N-acetylglucosaminyltransferase